MSRRTLLGILSAVGKFMGSRSRMSVIVTGCMCRGINVARGGIVHCSGILPRGRVFG